MVCAQRVGIQIDLEAWSLYPLATRCGLNRVWLKRTSASTIFSSTTTIPQKQREQTKSSLITEPIPKKSKCNQKQTTQPWRTREERGLKRRKRNRRGSVKNEAVVFVVCFVVVYIAELVTILGRRKYKPNSSSSQARQKIVHYAIWIMYVLFNGESMFRCSMYVLCTRACQNGCFKWRVTWSTWLQWTDQKCESKPVIKRLFVMRCLTWICTCMNRIVEFQDKEQKTLNTVCWNWDSHWRSTVTNQFKAQDHAKYAIFQKNKRQRGESDTTKKIQYKWTASSRWTKRGYLANNNRRREGKAYRKAYTSQTKKRKKTIVV